MVPFNVTKRGETFHRASGGILRVDVIPRTPSSSPHVRARA